MFSRSELPHPQDWSITIVRLIEHTFPRGTTAILNCPFLCQERGKIKGILKMLTPPGLHRPLSNLDRNVIQLLPTYRPVFKSSRPGNKTVMCVILQWGCADWDIFFQSTDIDMVTESIRECMCFLWA